MRKIQISILVLLTFLVAASGCKTVDGVKVKYGIFTVTNDTSAVMDGVIRSRTLDDYNDMIAAHPGITELLMEDVPGSADDETNVQLGRAVYNQQLNTRLPDGGMIASGGVDLFLAGRNRTAGNNTMIGVHSWSGGGTAPVDLPVDDPEHDRYISYYQDIGWTEQAASDFYFFTIHAAPASDIHYMTEAEIDQYGVLTE